SQSGRIRTDEMTPRTISFELPREINSSKTRVDLSLVSGPWESIFEALPYLAGYPYGCVEQTMSRFYPSVLVKDTLKKMGTDLESVGKQRKQMYPPDLKNRFGQDHDPVFDSEELDR